MATKKKKKGGSGVGEAIGAGAAVLGAAGAATYYFYGTAKAKKHRQAASAWAKGLERDVKKEVKSLKKIDAKSIARIVDDAAAAYQGVRGVASTDVREAAHELKRNWTKIQADLKPSGQMKKMVRSATGTAKKAAKKAVKKTPKSVKKVVKKAVKKAKKAAKRR